MPKKVKIADRIAPDLRRKVAEHIVDEWRGRKKRRADLEKHWDEIDRQLRMEPELSHKMDANRKHVRGLEWLPETELHLQAQTLEMLMADCRRLKFPKNRSWFSTRAALTDEYMQRYKNAGSPIPGDRGPNQTDVKQDDADRIAQSVLNHFHSQYDFRAAVDLIDASAFTYTFGVGRLRPVRRKMLGQSALKGPREEVIPVLIPRDARKVYLDDNAHAVMYEGEVVGPNIIEWSRKLKADLVASARTDDTYIKDQIMTLVPDDKGYVDVVELEGDLVVDCGSEVVVERNVCATAAVGTKEGKDTFSLIRVQEAEDDSTYFVAHYQQEHVGSVYGSSPLLKGMPIARIASQIMNRLLESASLKNAPPIGYGRDDPAFALSGGPIIHPYAKWETVDPLQVYNEVGGDPSALFAIYQGLVAQYYDVTGVTPARLGAMTKSHTTAFAKDVEMSRGESRTVDFVNQSLEGWMNRLLDAEYRMGRKRWSKRVLYIDPWKEFAEIERDHLPDMVHFVADGAGSPAEDEARQQRKFNALQAAIQLDTLGMQRGEQPIVDIQAAIQDILEEGGWTDPAEVTLEQAPQTQPAEQGQLPGVATANPTTLL